MKIIQMETFPKSISEEIEDLILIKQRLEPIVQVIDLVVIGNPILREGNNFTTILFHVVIGHDILSQIDLDQKKSALIGLDLINKHGCLFDIRYVIQFFIIPRNVKIEEIDSSHRSFYRAEGFHQDDL